MNTTEIRLSALVSKGTLGVLFRLFGPIADRILGLKEMNDRFRKHGLTGLDPKSFVEKVLEALKVKIDYEPEQLQRIPKEGPVVIVANHPYGGIEGIILAALIGRVRSDVKFLVNTMLRVVVELRDLFIFTNPLVKNHAGNIRSLRLCREWLDNSHLLVIFPAGRVAFYQRGKGMITDGSWNRIAARMVRLSHAPVVPIHISGTNSPLFDFLGRIYYRFRLLMLPRELLKAENRSVTVRIGKPIPYAQLSRFNSSGTLTRYLRMRTYLLDSDRVVHIRNTKKDSLPIVAAVSPQHMQTEIDSLPKEQRLLSLRNTTVYYAYYEQIPQTVVEIARLREIAFRELDEGSGQALDTDGFDKTYIHLFLWDESERQIIGSYRMGPLDRLLQGGDVNQLYLSRLFRFSPSFLERVTPGLEMGRSFLRKEHQRTFYGLLLLWRGIGEFILRHPYYHTLYGTVSLSTTYHPYSLALMSKVLVGEKLEVEPIKRFKPILPIEVELYVRRHRPSVKELSRLVKAIEPNNIDIPILVKQYLRIGARFHSIAVDRGFNNTPGALLSVDLRRASPEAMKLYMGEKYPDYLRHQGIVAEE